MLANAREFGRDPDAAVDLLLEIARVEFREHHPSDLNELIMLIEEALSLKVDHAQR